MPPSDRLFGEARLGAVARWVNVPFILAIGLYRITLSPFIGRQCRFEPTCSRYALGAYRRFGPFVGTWLTIRRIGRCHPFHAGGYDPVPPPPSDLGARPIDSQRSQEAENRTTEAHDEPTPGREAP